MQTPPAESSPWNLPNLITLVRLALSLVLFGMIDWGGHFGAAAVLFVVAVATDALDGYIARRYALVTTVGRILDPFVDKIIICGAFVFLTVRPESGVTAWMTLALLAREMLVTALRSFLEQQGQDFSAAWIGKVKMVVQSVAVTVALAQMSPALPETLRTGPALIVRDVLLWGTVAITLYSGGLYTQRAVALMFGKQHPPT